MPGSKKERLTCYVTPEVKKGLEALGREIQLKKGGLAKAYRQLLQQAYADRDATLRKFEGEETETCSLEATPGEIAELHAYQTHHKIGEQRKGFKSALLRGYSIHLAENEGK